MCHSQFSRYASVTLKSCLCCSELTTNFRQMYLVKYIKCSNSEEDIFSVWMETFLNVLFLSSYNSAF